MSEHRDPLVVDALRRLDVPDHGPDFWEGLEARLAGDPAGGDASHVDEGEESAVVDLAASPAARRRVAARNRTPMVALAAAVAVVVALVVGAAVLRPGDDESGLDTAGDVDDAVDDTTDPVPAPEDSAAEDSGPDTSAPPPTDPDTTERPTETVAEAADPAAPETTATRWLEALGDGDTEAAHAMLDAPSRSALPLGEFRELASGLAEGAAAFTAEGIDRSVTSVETTAGPVAVVTFTGDVQREGMVETDSYPVVVTGAGVHFHLDGPRLELDPEYAQQSGSTLASPLQVEVSTDVVWMWIDGGAPDYLPVEDAISVEIDVEQLAGPGTHVVSLLAADGDLVTARSYTVVVP